MKTASHKHNVHVCLFNGNHSMPKHLRGQRGSMQFDSAPQLLDHRPDITIGQLKAQMPLRRHVNWRYSVSNKLISIQFTLIPLSLYIFNSLIDLNLKWNDDSAINYIVTSGYCYLHIHFLYSAGLIRCLHLWLTIMLLMMMYTSNLKLYLFHSILFSINKPTRSRTESGRRAKCEWETAKWAKLYNWIKGSSSWLGIMIRQQRAQPLSVESSEGVKKLTGNRLISVWLAFRCAVPLLNFMLYNLCSDPRRIISVSVIN